MSTGGYRVAIVGGATLKGKELADVLSERKFRARDIRLLDDDESLGQLETVGDEVSFVQSVSPDQFDDVDIAFFASEEKFTRRSWLLARSAGCAIVDLSYALETEPGATVRAPWVERELARPVTPELQPAPVVMAHPAAVVLALLLLRAQKAGVMRAVAATVIEPASEHGRRGMDELHEQTVSLLSFRELPKQVFDAQVAFNMLAQRGDGSLPSLQTIEHRISRHFNQITMGLAPAPALMLLQGPSFHGHAFAVYIELDRPTPFSDFANALSGEHLAVTHLAEEAPSNVNAAGQDNVLLTVRPDAQRKNGFWLWAAEDNLRLIALNAVECAESIAATRPRGKVQ
ncbi:MAG: Asd/ArgC dimerization domain-containing protein [Terriglobales bacterium]